MARAAWTKWRRGATALAPMIAALAAASFAWAAGPSWLRHVFTSHMEGEERQPPSARYIIDSGGDFVLDLTGGHPLLKFEDNPEVWALTVSRGPRGDLIYYNDLRQPMLRVTKFGGVTVFTPRLPQGAAATVEGPCSPLRLATLGPVGLYQRLAIASLRSGRAAQHAIGYTAIDADAGSDGVMADAALVTSEAIMTLASHPRDRSLLRRVTRVNIIQGRTAGASLRGGTVLVTVAPQEGLFGRPSPLKIEQALRRH